MIWIADYAISGTTTQYKATGDTDGDQFAVSLGIGYEWQLDNGFSAELFSRLDYIDANIDAYNETGAQELNLAMDDQNFDSSIIALGGYISKAFNQNWGVILPQARFSWENEQSDAYTIGGRFVNDPTNTLFQLESDEPDSSYFRLELGLSTVMANGISAFVNYETILERDDYSEKGATFGLNFSRSW